MALPRWQDVVGYEEKKPEVVNALTSGYPRFFIHAEVRELARQIGDGQPCLPFPVAPRRPAVRRVHRAHAAASRRKCWRSGAFMAS